VTTGYGMRRWLEVADAAGLGAELTAALEEARIFARGPKAHGAVRAAGLLDAQTSDLDTTASLVDAAIAAGLCGCRVAVQLHGYTDETALTRLAEISSEVMTVTPYRWAQPDPPDRLSRLIRAACQRQLEALTFTSAPAAAATLELPRRWACSGSSSRPIRTTWRVPPSDRTRQSRCARRDRPFRLEPVPARGAGSPGDRGADKASHPSVPYRWRDHRAARAPRLGR
jgi:Uroporphyrinogen-III synthase HemD